MNHTSAISRGCSICHPWNVDDLSVVCTKNYVDGYGKLPEDQEGDGNMGNLPN